MKLYENIVISCGVITCWQMGEVMSVNKSAGGVLHDMVH